MAFLNRSYEQFVEFHEENGIGEELHAEWTGIGGFKITRHRANDDTELQEWLMRNVYGGRPIIAFYNIE